jgi:hypothetical protein
MSNSKSIAFGLVGILAAGGAETPFAALNTLSNAEKKAGWILLFDGKDKDTYWRHGETGSNPSRWTVEDSSMKAVPSYSFLCTKTAYQYSNFEWHAEWKLGRAGNSGLFIRVVQSTYDDGFEYGILDDVNGGDRGSLSTNPADRLPNGSMPPIKRTGGIYDLYPTTKDGQIGGQFYDGTVSRPYNQWSQGVIWAEGNHIEQWLNGKKVVVAEIGSADWNARLKNSKWGSYDPNKWARNAKGSLCMQAHGGSNGEELVWFRNMKVRPFTPGDTLVSPSATPTGGNFSSTVKVGLEVAITGATIRYTLDGSEPTETSPVYTDSISLTATTTLKAKTFRARFKNSSTTTATFTKSGTAIGDADLSPVPEATFTPMQGGFIVHNGNGAVFNAVIRDMRGARVAAFTVPEKTPAYTVSGLKGGVYLVQLQRGAWTQVRKLALN